MKISFKKRLGVYAGYLAFMCGVTTAVIYFNLLIDSFIGLYILTVLLNLLFGWRILKIKPALTLPVSMLISALGIYSGICASFYPLFPGSDPYGILTAIITNAIVAVLLWEMALQSICLLKHHINKKAS